MTLAEIKDRLKDVGIVMANHTLRRRIDVYISHATRGRLNNYRDITQEEFGQLVLALALESKGVSELDVKDYLEGKKPKVGVVENLLDSGKVDNVIRQWINQ